MPEKNARPKTERPICRRMCVDPFLVHCQSGPNYDSVLDELSVSRQLLAEVDKRRLRYAGHANRSKYTDLMATALQGKTAGKRKRGRPPMSYIGNLKEACGLNGLQQMVEVSRDRERWRNLVTERGAPTIDDSDGEM